MLVLFFHGSNGMNEISKKYIQFLSKFIQVHCEEYKPYDKWLCEYGLGYKTNVRNILNNEIRYKCIYNVIRKQREKHVFEMIDKYRDSCILIGISEGAIGIAGVVHKLIRKKIMIGYSGEQNYFTWNRNPVSRYIPTYIFIGEHDPYFSGEESSVAFGISKKSKFYPKHEISGYSKMKNVNNIIVLNKGHNVYCSEVCSMIKKIILKE